MSESRTEPLADVLDFREGPGVLAVDFHDSGVPLVRLAGLKAGANLLDGCNYLDEAKVERRWSQFKVVAGDTLLSTSASLGEVAVVPSWAEGAVPYTGIIRFRPKDGRLLASIVQRVLTTKSFRDQIEAMGVGSVLKHFGPSHLKQMTISYPVDLAKQCAIVEILDVLDDKIAANQKAAALTWAVARAEFSRETSELDFEPTTLGEANSRGWLTLSDGYRTNASEYRYPGLRILRAGDLQPDRIRATGQDYVAHDYARQIGNKASQAGDIVVTTKGTVGRVAVVPRGSEQFVYSPQLCFFRVLEEDQLDRGFLSAWFRSRDFQAQAEARMFKSDMAPYINLDDIRSMIVPVPESMEVQRRVGSLQSGLERLAHSKDRENSVLASTRDELLPLLMSGKLRVKDAEKVVEDAV